MISVNFICTKEKFSFWMHFLRSGFYFLFHSSFFLDIYRAFAKLKLINRAEIFFFSKLQLTISQFRHFYMRFHFKWSPLSTFFFLLCYAHVFFSPISVQQQYIWFCKMWRKNERFSIAWKTENTCGHIKVKLRLLTVNFRIEWKKILYFHFLLRIF